MNKNVVWQNNIAYMNGTSLNGASQAWAPDVISASNNKLNVNPLLVNPTGANFSLQPTSPAINTGVAQLISLPTPDIGAL